MKRHWLTVIAAIVLGCPLAMTGCGGPAPVTEEEALELDNTAELTEDEMEMEAEADVTE